MKNWRISQPEGSTKITDETFMKQTAQEADNLTTCHTGYNFSMNYLFPPWCAMLAQQRGIASQELRDIRGTGYGWKDYP